MPRSTRVAPGRRDRGHRGQRAPLLPRRAMAPRVPHRSGRPAHLRRAGRRLRRVSGPPAEGDDPPGPRGERIAKWLARAGVASRRDAERLLAEGRVRLNNARRHPPRHLRRRRATSSPSTAGLVDAPERTRLWRYHKPDGLVTTHRDPEGRPTVFERTAARPAPRRQRRPARPDQRGAAAADQRRRRWRGGWSCRRPAGCAATACACYGAPEQAALAALARGVTIEGVRYGPIEAGLD